MVKDKHDVDKADQTEQADKHEAVQQLSFSQGNEIGEQEQEQNHIMEADIGEMHKESLKQRSIKLVFDSVHCKQEINEGKRLEWKIGTIVKRSCQNHVKLPMPDRKRKSEQRKNVL